MKLDWKEVSAKLFSWFKGKPENIHLDGKAIKGSIENADNKNQSFVMVISAYSSDLKRTLGIEAIDSNKESEVAAARKLIERLGLEGVIMTGDALHSTIKTMEGIKESGNEYILQVKKNRPAWYEEAAKICREEAPEDESRSIEKNKGRVEIREVSVYGASERLKGKKLGIRKIVRVIRNGKVHYYFSSVSRSAKELGEIIRSHWSVEGMHYMKDVVMEEDAGRTKNKTLAVMLSILRAFAMNVLFAAGFKSPTSFTRLYSHKINDLINFI